LLPAIALGLLAVAVFEPFALSGPQIQDSKANQIKVRLIPQSKRVKVGDSLDVRVEVWNVGAKQFFIEKSIYAVCQRSPLSLRLECGFRTMPITHSGVIPISLIGIAGRVITMPGRVIAIPRNIFHRAK
jgi:hypothetical protein